MYRVLLAFFPAPMRERHGEDMAQLFADRCREAGEGVSLPRRTLRVAALWFLAFRDAVVNGLLARGSGTSPAPGGNRRRSAGPARRESLLSSVANDLRLAMRGLRAAPGFTVIALASLALGIGASTAIFTLINVVVLRPLPVVDPGSLLKVYSVGGPFESSVVTNPMWEALRDHEDIFDGAFAFSGTIFFVGDTIDTERREGSFVSGAFFSTLGLQPAAGRLLDPSDDVRGCTGVAVLGHGYWQRQYGGDPEVLGDTIVLRGKPFEIVGVAPRGFTGMTLETDRRHLRAAVLGGVHL